MSKNIHISTKEGINSQDITIQKIEVSKPKPYSIIISPKSPEKSKSLSIQPQIVEKEKELLIESQKEENDVNDMHSLLGTVKWFENTKTFNDTDLNSLGFDLSDPKSFLFRLKSITSDRPFGDYENNPYQVQIADFLPAKEFIRSSPDDTLLFAFFCQPSSEIQIIAAETLIRRGYSYKGKWKSPDGMIFNPELWCFEKEI